MKKAKFMLLGIAIVGVVGGAMAFNAKKFTGVLVCADAATSLVNCTITADPTAVNEDATKFCTDPTIPNVTQCATSTKIKLNP